MGTEHIKTRLPLIDKLIELGWSESQIQYKPEWRVPKTPSEASKRELGNSFKSFPVDVAIFSEPKEFGNWEQLKILIETKSPDITTGLNQLEIYLSLEPRVFLGVWTNGSEVATLHRLANGLFKCNRKGVLPKPTDSLILSSKEKIKYEDLITVDIRTLKRVFTNLLDHIVAVDSVSTRRDDQLNQLCNILLLKIESDKASKVKRHQPVNFQVWGSENETANKIREYFEEIKLSNSDLFSASKDTSLNLEDSTIQKACYELARFKLIDQEIDVMSTAFQVFRSASLKAEEGQYYTPYPVIRSAVELMEITYDDVIIDPACGTGGFLIECFNSFRKNNPEIENADVKAWAQKHLYGIDKDSINVKLTKSMMMILGDGSTHTYLGDSLRSHLWHKNYPHLQGALQDSSYSCIITNPPFGKGLKLPKVDAKECKYSICHKPATKDDAKGLQYEERELGIVFLERCYNLLVEGGRLGIILPETYFFSTSYIWLQEWLKKRYILRGMLNIPMEAFQGFCRAKTNFYVFEKRGS